MQQRCPGAGENSLLKQTRFPIGWEVAVPISKHIFAEVNSAVEEPGSRVTPTALALLLSRKYPSPERWHSHIFNGEQGIHPNS